MSDPLKDTDAEVSAGKADPKVAYWAKELELAEKRVRKYRKKAKQCTDLYELAEPRDNSFNILYSNTETLLPSVYNKSPRPVVERRFHDADPIGKCVSETLERTLSYLLDTNSDEYEKYHALFRQAVLMALVPGQGITWWKYDPQIREADEAREKPEDGPEVVGQILPKSGAKVLWETVCGDDVSYEDFLHGYARRWVDVPWISRRHSMTRDDAEDNFGEELAEELKYVINDREAANEEGFKTRREDEGKNEGSALTAEVFEIWDKATRSVLFYAPSLKEKLCDKPRPDPYGLSSFFPVYRPLHFMKAMSGLIPVPPYQAYESQAKLLNNITARISRIVNAMKVRGFYDGTLQGLKELLSADDNTLIAAKNVAAMQNGQNIANSIWFMPLNELITVLNELFSAQNQCKNTIYEITGIADIMRGDTQASETYGAQKIKDKWGTLRLQNMQGATQDYIRGCLRIVATLAGKHFSIETFAAMTSLDYATPQQVQQAQQIQRVVQQQMLALQQQQAQAAVLQPPQPPGVPPSAPPPMGPPPAQLSPQLQQAGQQAQMILAKPQWGAILAILRDNLQRQYRIDIETNSTLADTTAEDQANVAAAMTAIANTAESFGPLVQEGVLTMPALKQLMLTIVRRYEFGRQVEAQIESMPDQIPPKEDPKAQAAQQKLQQDQQALQQAQMKLEQDKAAVAQKAQADAQALQQQQVAGEQDMAARETQLAAKQKEVSDQIAAAQQAVADAAQKALQEQEMSQKKFLLDMELRLAKSEMANEKRNMQTTNKIAADKQERKAEAAVQKSELDARDAKRDADEAKKESKPETKGDDPHKEAIGALLKSHQDLAGKFGELAQAVAKPRKMVIERDAKGRAIGGSSTVQ